MSSFHHLRAPRRALRLAAVGAVVALLSWSPRLAAQEIVFAIEHPQGGHDLLAVDETTLSLRVLQPWVELLPVKLAGYGTRDRLRLDRPRLLDADGAAPHVKLPSLGSLYRYRSKAGGATRLGLSRADGGLAVLGSLADQGGVPALGEWVTIDPTGRWALLTTDVTAGGDVLLLDLQSESPWINLTSLMPPLAVDGESLRLAGSRAWFTAGGSLYRVRLDQTLDAERVGLPLQPGDVLVPETAVSADGRFLAVVLDNPATGDAALVSVPPDGNGVLLSATRGAYDPPSYDSPIGPLLAVSPDGTRIAFRQRIAGSRELFVQRSLPSAPSKQVTEDAVFTDTIDNVGVVGFTNDGLLVFAAGEGVPTGPNAHIEGADIFLMDTTGPAGSTPVNVTNTSGFPSAPFDDYGTLDIRGVTVDPLNERLLLDVDPTNGDHALVLVTLTGPTAGHTEILSRLAAPPMLAPAGDAVLALSRSTAPGSFDYTATLVPAGTGAPVTLAGVDGTGLDFVRFAADRAGVHAAFVASFGTGVELPGMVDVSNPALAPLWSTTMSVSPALAFTPSGRLAVGLGFPGGPYIHVGFDGPGTGVVYPLHPNRGFALDN